MSSTTSSNNNSDIEIINIPNATYSNMCSLEESKKNALVKGI